VVFVVFDCDPGGYRQFDQRDAEENTERNQKFDISWSDAKGEFEKTHWGDPLGR
jgi:hypothetical protein